MANLVSGLYDEAFADEFQKYLMSLPLALVYSINIYVSELQSIFCLKIL